MIEFEIRDLGPPATASPAAGELWLCPREHTASDCRRLSEYVIEHGTAGLVCGAGPIRHLVIRPQPTLDDMLAAEIVARLLHDDPRWNAEQTARTGGNLPDTPADWLQLMRPFARYAAIVRSGLRPTDLPLEKTLEGVFLAIVAQSSGHTSELQRQSQFFASWAPLASRMLTSARAGADPFSEDLVSAGHEFAEAQSYLRADRQVYRQDIAHGEVWDVSASALQGSAAKPSMARAHALLLRNPRSLLFKHWSRDDREAPGGIGYLLLVVHGPQPGRWVISSDPAQRLSLQPLHSILQQAETASDPEFAAEQPWFDGQAFDHSLIAAPKAGSRLADGAVLSLIRTWCDARTVRGQAGGETRVGRLTRRQLLTAGAAVVAGASALATFVGPRLWPRRPGSEPGSWRSGTDELAPLAGGMADWKREGVDRAVLIATDNYRSEFWPTLFNPVRDAEAIEQLLRDEYQFETTLLRDPELEQVLEQLRSFHEQGFAPDDQLLVYVAGHGALAPSGKEGFLVLTDSKSPREDPSYSTYLAQATLRDIVEKINCPHLLVTLDVCFASSFDFGEAMRGATDPARPADPAYASITRSEFVRRKLGRPGRLWLTSGAKEPVPDGMEGQHSPFARRYLEALESHGGDDGVLTFYELLTHVEHVSGSQPRSGTLRHHESGGDFLFIRHPASL